MRRIAVLATLILAGCAADPMVLNSCQRAPHFYDRLVVWGEEPTSTSTAIGWLEDNGYSIVELPRLAEMLRAQRITLTHTHEDEANLIRVAKLADASMLVLIETSAANARPHGFGRLTSTPGASVSLRIIDLGCGEVIQHATANLPTPVGSVDDQLVRLTRAALTQVFTVQTLRDPYR